MANEQVKAEVQPLPQMPAGLLGKVYRYVPGWSVFWELWNGASGQRFGGFIASLLFHGTVLLAMALWLVGPADDWNAGVIDFEIDRDPFSGLDADPPGFQVGPVTPTDVMRASTDSSEANSQIPDTEPMTPWAVDANRATNRIASNTTNPITGNPAMIRSGPTGGGLEGRTGKLRLKQLREKGGNEASETALGQALAWIAAHQREDGSWHFDFAGAPCHGACSHPATSTKQSDKSTRSAASSTTAATALALLPFLGAGYTHIDSKYRTPEQNALYKDVVKRGIDYLVSRQVVTDRGGDMQEGTMYAQGLATIVLCEAYAMTEDSHLSHPCQYAVDFIISAQHKQGGWRYYPGQPGDISVTAWQVMALKSAHLAGIAVPSSALDRVRYFLDDLETYNGAHYGYIKKGQQPGPTAMGLLLRMYLGWMRRDARIDQGTEYLAEEGPSATDMYYNYYAAQVMMHRGGPRWKAWNVALRDFLIKTQSHKGHESGSWHFDDQFGNVGGRLYTTAMCAMILEVYYRYMPLYDEKMVDFQL